jgi:hypothetical protein
MMSKAPVAGYDQPRPFVWGATTATGNTENTEIVGIGAFFGTDPGHRHWAEIRAANTCLTARDTHMAVLFFNSIPVHSTARPDGGNAQQPGEQPLAALEAERQDDSIDFSCSLRAIANSSLAHS